MNKGLYRKGFVFGLILLFIIGSISSIVTAINDDTEYEDEEINNFNESEGFDNHIEIITFINGGYDFTWTERRGFFRGEVEIWGKVGWEIPLDLFGLRITNGRLEIFSIGVIYAHVYFFRGFCLGEDKTAFGYALGNIDWE
jgi:hypothetical protein